MNDETYQVKIQCTNCGYGNDVYIGASAVYLDIPKGIPVENHVYTKSITCKNCGCKDCLTRYGLVLKIRDES